MSQETEISSIGEFGLIDRLTTGIEPVNKSTITGVGDDCAVVRYPQTDVLVTTDMLLEGVHFDLTTSLSSILATKPLWSTSRISTP